jgi:carboxypeptidase family protein
MVKKSKGDGRRGSVHWLLPSLLLVGLCMFASSLAWGQVTSGSVTGVVTDPTGAVVPGAKIALTDTNKGYNYLTTADATGRYLITNLLPSTYKISVDAPGFKGFIQSGIVVDVEAKVAVDVHLVLGATTQAVEVTGAAPVLSTQDAVTGQEVDRALINDLPLVDRDVLDLAFLAPGVLQVPGGTYGLGTGLNFVSNGGRNDTAEILVDGVAATSYEPNTNINTILYEPSVEAVQEFKIMQNNFTAEEGFSGNTYINMVLRSGTNAFHGDLYEFLRNDKLDSNNWFSNAAGGKLPPHRRNQFGGTIGGPIKKDKTFFFFDYDGTREHYGQTANAGVPSLLERQGDFGELCTRIGGAFDASGKCSDPNGQVWDPYSGYYANGITVGSSQYWGRALQNFVPFNNMATYQSPGNPGLAGTPYQLPAVPGNLIDPVAAKMIQYYPMPNVNVGTPAYNPYNNWSGSGIGINIGNQFDVRIDQRFTDKTAFNARFSHGWGSYHSWNCFGNALDVCTQGPGVWHTNSVALSLNHTFSPSTLLNVSLGFSRNIPDTKGVAKDFPGFNPITTLGLPSYLGADNGPIAAPSLYIYGGYAGAAGSGDLGAQSWSIYKNGNQVYHLLSTLTHMHGRHELKFGGEFRVNQMNWFQDGTPGGLEIFNYYGTSQYLYNPDSNFLKGIGGDGMASFLTGVGDPWAWGQYEISPHFSTQNYRWGGFTQDNWRATDKLTVNIGLRYDLEIPRTERYNRGSWFDPAMSIPIKPNPIDVASWPSVLPMPNLSNPKGGLVFMNANQRHPVDTYYKDLGPRVGLSYRVRSNLVLRGGYGLFYNPTEFGTTGAGPFGNEGFDASTNWLTTRNGDGVTPWGRLSNPFPDGLLYPTGPSQGNLTHLGLGVDEPTRNENIPPYTQTWSGGFQYQLPGNWLIDANYVGTKGTHLYYLGGGGQQYFGPWIEKEATDPALQGALGTYVPNPYYGVINSPGCGICGSTITADHLLLSYPQFSGVTFAMPPVANSSYHAFQLKVEKRLSNGLSMLVTYTNSKSIDDASIGTYTSWIGGFSKLRDPNNMKLERSLSEWDIPQVFQIAYLWQLPFGKGKKWGSGWNSIVNGFLGGWQTNGMWRFDNGQPIALSVSGATAPDTYAGGSPNQTGVLKVNPKSQWFTNGYFANANAVLSVPPNYTIGTAPRMEPNVRVPGTKNATLSVFKEFPLSKVREGSKLQFRAEAFNALNHPQFGNIATTFNQGGFGDVQSQVNVPRQVQLALKLIF